jgi:hypothetical protein
MNICNCCAVVGINKLKYCTRFFFPHGATAPSGTGSPRYRGFTITQSDTPHSVGFLRESDQAVAETSNLTTHNIHKKQPSMPPAGFEPSIPAS